MTPFLPSLAPCTMGTDRVLSARTTWYNTEPHPVATCHRLSVLHDICCAVSFLLAYFACFLRHGIVAAPFIWTGLLLLQKRAKEAQLPNFDTEPDAFGVAFCVVIFVCFVILDHCHSDWELIHTCTLWQCVLKRAFPQCMTTYLHYVLCVAVPFIVNRTPVHCTSEPNAQQRTKMHIICVVVHYIFKNGLLCWYIDSPFIMIRLL